MEKTVDKWLEAITEKLGLGVEHFWPIIMRQQNLEAIIEMFSIIFFMAVAIVIGKMLYKKFIEENAPLDFDDYSKMCCILLIITGMTIVLNGLTILMLTEVVTKLINPEYHAIMDIGRTLKP